MYSFAFGWNYEYNILNWKQADQLQPFLLINGRIYYMSVYGIYVYILDRCMYLTDRYLEKHMFICLQLNTHNIIKTTTVITLVLPV